MFFGGLVTWELCLHESDWLSKPVDQCRVSSVFVAQIPPRNTYLSSDCTSSLATMLCPEFVSIGNGLCDESNNKLLCYYDGGDCSMEWIYKNCTNFECFENPLSDPCPMYNQIGNGKCDTENFNIICLPSPKETIFYRVIDLHLLFSYLLLVTTFFFFKILALIY